jgi:hypothetical protein
MEMSSVRHHIDTDSLSFYCLIYLVHQIYQVGFPFLKVIDVFLISHFMILIGGHIVLSETKYERVISDQSYHSLYLRIIDNTI